jgi:hypothetical protein
MDEPLWAVSSLWLGGRRLNRTEQGAPRVPARLLEAKKTCFYLGTQRGRRPQSLDLGFTLRLSVVSFRPDWLCRASTRAVGRRFQRGAPVGRVAPSSLIFPG